MQKFNLAMALLFTLALIASENTLARSRHHHNDQNNNSGNTVSGGDQPGNFDYYLLSLSWSPAFCASPAGHKPEKQSQCGAHFGFVIHGLWPQNNKGYPQNCGPAEEVPPEIAAIPMSGDIQVPPGDPDFVNHEWSKHGTCSGLKMNDYFSAVKNTASKIKIPEQLATPSEPIKENFNTIAQQFADSNPGLTADSLQVSTDKNGYVNEIRICFDKQLTTYQACTGNSPKNGGTFLPIK